jgi:hypothetical protein
MKHEMLLTIVDRQGKQNLLVKIENLLVRDKMHIMITINNVYGFFRFFYRKKVLFC